MKRIYWLYAYLIGYLAMQLHEVLHWIAARLFGYGGTVAIYSYSFSASGPPWHFAVIAAAGGLSTILYQIAGLILFRSQDLFLKRTGFVLILINAVGRVLYEFAEVVIGASGDEANLAYHLGVPEISIRAPITLFCVLVLIYVLVKDRQTGMKTVGWILSLASSFVAVIVTVLSLGALFEALSTSGSVDLSANLGGYPFYLMALNAAMLGGLLFLVANRQKHLAAAP